MTATSLGLVWALAIVPGMAAVVLVAALAEGARRVLGPHGPYICPRCGGTTWTPAGPRVWECAGCGRHRGRTPVR